MKVRNFFISEPERIKAGKKCCLHWYNEVKKLNLVECPNHGLWKAEIYEEGKLYTTAKISKIYGSWVACYALLHLIYELRKENYKGKIEIESYNVLAYDTYYLDDILKGKYGLSLETFKYDDEFWYYLALARMISQKQGIIIKTFKSTEEKEADERGRQIEAEEAKAKMFKKMTKNQRINWIVEQVKSKFLKDKNSSNETG